MKIETAKFAVTKFKELKLELTDLVDALGLSAITATVRQRQVPEDAGWSFYDIGLEAGAVFWGKLRENRGPKNVAKDILIVLDLDDVDSIEIEVYDDDIPKNT